VIDLARVWAERIGPIGVWTADVERLGASGAREYVRGMETLGLRALWIPESLGSKEIFTHASLLLGATERLVVATGIANIWARDPVAMANGQRALAEAYPGRFLLGVGVSHAPVLEARGAHRYARPVERMSQYLEAMDHAPYTGPAPAEPVARVVAALGPRMLRLAAERGIGAHPYFVPVTHTPIARKELGASALLAVEQAAVLSTDATVARATARRHMERYVGLENYARNLKRLGWTDRDFTGGGSDALVDAIVAWGDAAAIRTRVEAHLSAGADHVCVQLLRADLKTHPLSDWRKLAPLLL